jgi:hypothetical protein
MEGKAAVNVQTHAEFVRDLTKDLMMVFVADFESALTLAPTIATAMGVSQVSRVTALVCAFDFYGYTDTNEAGCDFGMSAMARALVLIEPTEKEITEAQAVIFACPAFVERKTVDCEQQWGRFLTFIQKVKDNVVRQPGSSSWNLLEPEEEETQAENIH